MPKDAPPNGSAPDHQFPAGPWSRVSEVQAKLHRWAVAEPGRRFDDLFNLVHDPATLTVAFDRVAGNQGARTPGVDGLTVTDVEEQIGVPGFLDDLRTQVKEGSFRPLPVRERKIPKRGGTGRVRSLGIPTVADRVVQAALKLVLEPIFEADFLPVSYGFRPKRRAQDAIAEIHHYSTRGYQWVLDADIEACFDRIDHAALMDRVRLRVKDKRVLALVKAFLKAGVLTEHGDPEDSKTGTPQGGILSPLLANIALSVLDEHLMAPWQQGGSMSTVEKRRGLRRRGLPTWRLIRYADDFVVLVHGANADMQALREEIAKVLAPLGLRLSPAKTQVVHLSEGFDFLGFHIQWRRKRGTDKWFVYTFIADRPVRAVKRKIRALTRRTSQIDLRTTLIRINQITRGWVNYFRHAVAKHTFAHLKQYIWWRIVRWQRAQHRWNWTDVRRWLTTPTGAWKPITADGIELFNPVAVPITRYRYRGTKIPNPWAEPASTKPSPQNRGEPGAHKCARRVRRAAWRNGPGATQTPRSRPTQLPST
ncbi:MAG: group II intron reverse transcriptase/maturase [Streptomycetales bacterium]